MRELYYVSVMRGNASIKMGRFLYIMSRNRKKIKSKVVKTAAVMGALVLAASPVIPCVGSLGVGVMSVSAAYEATAKVTKVDFQNMEKNVVNIQNTTGTIGDEKWVVDASNNGKLQSRGSDAQFNNGTKITIPVSGKGTITVVSYPNYHNYTVGGKEVDKDTYVYEYDVADAKDATVDIVATGTSYLYSIEKFENTYKPDFEYNAENYKTGTKTYDFTSNSTDKPVVGQVLNKTDIIYQNAGSSSGCTFDASQLRFRPGVVLLIPLKDDTTAIKYTMTGAGNNAGRPTYFGSADSGYSVEYDYTSELMIDDIDGLTETVDGKKYLKIISGGDIKIKKLEITEYNPLTTVSVSGKAGKGVDKVVYKNQETGVLYTADVDADGNYSVDLKRVKGNTKYSIAVVSDDYMVDPNNNILNLIGNDETFTNDITLIEAKKARLTGKITGIDSTLLKGELKATLVPEDSAFPSVNVTLTADKDGSYSFNDVAALAGYKYSLVLENADDYEVTDVIEYAEGTYDSVSITATKKATQTVSGKFVTSDDGKSDITEITFTNMDTPDYKYTFTVDGGTYTAKLRAGEYKTTVKSTSGKYSAYDHVSVSDSEAANDVYLQGSVDNSEVAYQSQIKVGTGQQFETIAKAVSYVSRMTRTENQRVTIVLTDAMYREQIIIDTPNVTITSDRKAGSTISWYYGVGYSYYSAKLSADKKSAYYDEAYAVDKYYKQMISQNPGHWGATVNLFSGAKGFKAEGITFENSFNRYMTTEEVVDGVGKGQMNSSADRSAPDINVKAYKSKERSCVLYIQADDTEYSNCKLLSSQDTLYTGDSTESSYFSDCVIEGNTDYICGDGNAVFDNCTLSMYGYSDKNATDSIIVANKKKAESGYLFNNCKVVNTSFEGLKPTDTFYLARSWDRGCKLAFINTEIANDTKVIDEGFTNMNGDKTNVADSVMKEYNTHNSDGVAADTSKRTKGTIILTKEQADAIDIPSYLGDFNATYYYADYTKVDEAIAAADKLNAADYLNFSEVAKAKEAVVRNLAKQEQSKVDSMADAINNAISNLVKASSGVDTGKDAPSVEVKESVSDLIDNILSDDQKKDAEGKNVKIVLSVNKDIGVNEDDKKAAEKKLAELSSGKKAGMYLDIDLNVMIGNGNISVTETKKPIAIEVSVPDELINTDANKTRKYSVLRVHNGKVDVLDATYDENTKKLLFKSDVFSTYVLVYEDTVKNPIPENPTPENPTPENPTPENPSQENPTTEAPSTDEPATETPAGTEIKDGDKSAQTGDKSPIAALVSLLGLSGLGIFASTKKKRV